MKKQIYLIPYSHLDTQWRWEYSTTIDKYIKNTLEESIEMFKKYDHHRFNFTGAIRYQLMKEYFPNEFEEVKRLVKEDKWYLAGTCLDETDALLPNMESMIRNILYGDKWQKQEFGSSSLDYMIPDCFGFPANMPTVLSHCDINGFSSNKLTWKSAVGVPFEIGKLQGPDGSSIVSALNPCRYDSHMRLPIYLNPPRLNRLKTLSNSNDVHKSFQYYGVGDLGGSPKEVSVVNALKSKKHYDKKGDIEILQTSSSKFFEDITEEENSKLDTYQGDLLLINHSAGVLTSAAIMKRWNRKNEQMAYAAETASLMANSIAGLAYPSEKIEKAWTRVIGSQMHDILPGTCTPTAYDYSENDEVVALNTWSSILIDSAKAVASKINGDGEFLVFNPLVEKRSDTVKLDLVNVENKHFTHLVDSENNKYEVKIVNDCAYFKPVLKGMSYTKFKAVRNEVKDDSLIANKEENDIVLENEFLKVVIRDNGKIDTIINKKLDKNILKNPIAYELQHERPFKFPAWNMDWKDRKKPPKDCLETSDEVELVENNNMFATVKLVKNYDGSTLVKYVTVTKDSKMVEFKEEIDWYTKGCSLKVAFDASFNSPKATYNWESARMVRGVNNPKQFEVPSRMWMNFGNEQEGFSILEDCKYGYDHPTDSKIRLTLLFTPKIFYFNFFWDQRYLDFGHHTVKYSIVVNEGDFSNVDTLARQFNLKPRSYHIEGKSSNQKEVSEYISVENSMLGVSAVKKSEYSHGAVVRLYDRSGNSQSSKVTIKENIKAVYKVNGKEEKMFEVDHDGSCFNAEVIANGISAYLIEFDKKSSTVEQKHVELEFNSNVFDSEGFLPKNQVAEEIVSGNIKFKIDQSKNNAMLFDNQEIRNSGFNTLSLLVSATRDGKASLELDNKKVAIDVYNKYEKIGQWEKRQWSKEVKHQEKMKNDYVWINKYMGVNPGYIKRGRLDLFTTHSYKDGNAQTYEFGYVFRVDVDVKDVDVIKFLENSEVSVISATLSNQDIKVTEITKLEDLYDY